MNGAAIFPMSPAKFRVPIAWGRLASPNRRETRAFATGCCVFPPIPAMAVQMRSGMKVAVAAMAIKPRLTAPVPAASSRCSPTVSASIPAGTCNRAEAPPRIALTAPTCP